MFRTRQPQRRIASCSPCPVMPIQTIRCHKPTVVCKYLQRIITARIRRMGKVMFTVCPRRGGGGGQVSPAGGGSGQSSQGGQSSWVGGWVSQRGGGGGGSAKIGQQNEYSLHGGQYASCVHAGGLSCCIEKLYNFTRTFG